MTRPLVRSIGIVLGLSTVCFAQTGDRIRLFPQNAKPQKVTKTLTSTEKRIENCLYQIFYLKSAPKHEVFRVNIGFYDKGQLVKDWNYGIVREKDMNNDGVPDDVWYGGDDAGQRLLWFLSNDHHYKCIDIYKSAEAAWTKRFKRTAPDFGDVGGDDFVSDAIWDNQAQSLTVSIEVGATEPEKARSVNLPIAPAEFVGCD